MDERPLNRKELFEALECCRPGHNDAALPGMERLALALDSSPELDRRRERLEQYDAAVAAAFHDLPMSEGLEDRLLARLDAEPAVEPTVVPHRGRRRLLAAAATAVAVAAALLIAFFPLDWRKPETVRPVDWSMAISQFNSDIERGEFGVGQALDTAPEQYPFDSAVAAYPGTTWRPVEDFLGQSGVVYDLPVPGMRASLYVVRRTAPGVPSLPDPCNPLLTTGNRAVGAWQDGDRLYVLVVEGDLPQYRRLLHDSGPLT